MGKADTPNPEKKEEKKATTPSGLDTPAEKPKEESAPSTPQEKKVAGLEAEVERLGNLLTKQETIAKTSQRERAIAERRKEELLVTIQKVKTGEIDVSEISLPAEYTPSEEEGLKKDIQIGVQNLLLGNPDYQNLLVQDVTLREVIKKNPLVLIGDFFSVEDAVEQIREKLDDGVSSLKKTQPKEEKKEGEGSPEEFEAGLSQPKEDSPGPPPKEAPKTPDEKVEESIKNKINFT